MCWTEPVSSTLPWSSTVSRSQMSRMKSRSCSTMTREQRFLIGCSSSPVTRLSSRLMPPVGSSSSRSFGSGASAIAISSHCCWPWESAEAGSAARSTRRNCSSMAMARSCRMPRVRENTSRGSEVCACSASRMLSYNVNAGSTLVIWNLRLMPARARSAGEAREISAPPNITVPDVGISAPATHFISVLLPEPLGPIKPWNSFSATVRSAPFRAVSLPKILIRPRASRRAIVALPRRPAEIADALALAEDQADQAGGPEQDDQQQQKAEDDRPDLLIAVRQPEADRLDRDCADHGADQRAGAAEQHIKDDLRRHHDAEHVGPDETLVKRVKAACKPRDVAGKGKDDRLDTLYLIAEEGDPLLVLAQARQRQPELLLQQKAAYEIDQQENAEHHVVVDRPLG